MKLRAWVAVEPTEKALWLLTFVAVIGFASTAIISLDGVAPLALLALPVAAFTDWSMSTPPSQVVVKREFPARWHQGETATLTWRLRADRRTKLTLIDTLPPGSEPPQLERTVVLEPDEEVSFTLDVTHHERGRWFFGRAALRTLGPLGLLRRRERRQLGESIQVVPNLGRISKRAVRLLRGQDAGGARRRKLRQEGREFESLREYVRGDDRRLIAWKSSARAGQLVVKRMQPESRQDLMVVLDSSRQMAGRHALIDGSDPRLDVALTCVLTLAAAALFRGDRVGLLCLAGEVRTFVPAAAGHRQLSRLAEAVAEIESVPEEADYGAATAFLLARQKRRAMVTFVTDVLDVPSARSLAAAVAQLRARHLSVVIAIGDPAAARLSQLADAGKDDDERWLGMAAARLVEHRRWGLAAVGAMGAQIVDAPAPRAAALAVQTYVAVKAAGRL